MAVIERVLHAPVTPRFAVQTQPGAGRWWTGFMFLMLFTLTLPTLKLPIAVELRLGQLVLIAGFAVLVLRDLVGGRLHWGVLLTLVGAGVVLCAISEAAPYTKFKQATFFVKYLFVFPAAFYVGMRAFREISPARMAAVLETVLFVSCALALVLNWHPIPLLIHERPEGLATGLKGSFWEQGGFAFFIGLFMLGSVALRSGYCAWPPRAWPQVLVYLFALGCALASENRSVWIGSVIALMVAGMAYRPVDRDPAAVRRWGIRLVLLAVLGCAALFFYNAWLPPADKLLTMDILREKWNTERGAALRIAWQLIQDRPLMGHGFGFVEAFFGTWAIGIVGLGAGVAQIFNSYLDLWVSVGLFGLVYSLSLVWVVFDRRVLFTTFVVAYLFIFANINPVAQSEYYYLFLGASFALSRGLDERRTTIQLQQEVSP